MRRKMRLTDAGVRRLRPDRTEYIVWDSRVSCKIQSHLSKNPVALEQESNGLDRGCSACPGGDWRRIGLPDSERVSSGDAAGLEHLRGLSSGLNAAC